MKLENLFAIKITTIFKTNFRPAQKLPTLSLDSPTLPNTRAVTSNDSMTLARARASLVVKTVQETVMCPGISIKTHMIKLIKH